MVWELSIAASLMGGLLFALELGFQLGRRAVKHREAPSGGQVGAIQGAALGLLGLLLGFSFAGAASRFLERQDLIVEEANAIGTAYLRADMLDEPHASNLRGALEKYLRHRVEVSARLREGLAEDDRAMIGALHAAIWKAAAGGVNAKAAAMLAVLDPVNEVIDLHSVRVAAGRKHLPLLVLVLVIGCSLLGMGVIGYGCGMAGRRTLPMTGSLALLIAAALWTTIDLDHPRAGLIRLSDAPLAELRFGEGEQKGGLGER